MSDPLEAAGEALRSMQPDAFAPINEQADIARNPAHYAEPIVRAFMRAAIGHPKCGGTGKLSHTPDETPNHGCNRMCPCPSEHVEIVFLGETIWADPAKVVAYCTNHKAGFNRGAVICLRAPQYVDGDPDCPKEWLPKWYNIAGNGNVVQEPNDPSGSTSAIKGDET